MEESNDNNGIANMNDNNGKGNRGLRFKSKIIVAILGVLLSCATGFGVASLISFQKILRTSRNEVPFTRVISNGGLRSLQDSFRSIADKALPSIITIRVDEVREQEVPDGNSPWFDFFFGRPNEQERVPEFRSQAFGSGIVVRKDNNSYFAITNEHVVGDADSLTVILHDQSEVKALLVGKDTRKDIALISFDYTRADIPVATLGDSDLLEVGDWVLAIGSPFNLQSTVTAGIVSALGRRGGPQGNINDFIQTDAAINQGNSGGALVNINGEVIGMNTWITSRTGTNIGLGFSIPINNIKKPIDDFLEGGSVEYGWLGVSISTLSEEEALELLLQDTRGALVVNVFNDSPADKAGILPGDFITILNDQKVNNSDELLLEVGDLPVGKIAVMTIIRQGEENKIRVRITAREDEEVIAEQNRELWPGMRVSSLTDAILSDLELEQTIEGVVIFRIDPNGPAAVAGLRANDVITLINDNAVKSVPNFYQYLNQRQKGEIKFTFMRQDQTLSIGIVR